MPRTLSLIIETVNSCNLSCSYCYLPKTRDIPFRVIPEEFIVKSIIGTRELGIENVQYVWHGGEPLLAGINFYENIIKFQQEFGAPWQTFENVMQSNGTLINENWVKFFLENEFGVGISIDGHAEVHNKNRCTVNQTDSHNTVVNNFKILKENGCDGGICAVINIDNFRFAKEIIHFFDELNVPELDFLPCFHSLANPDSQSKAISAEQYGTFMIEAFDHWIEIDQPDYQIRFFRNILIMLMGGKSNFCKFTPEKCSNFIAIDNNGDVYPCDNFVGENSWKLGSLIEDDLGTILISDRRRKFLRRMNYLDHDCVHCPWLKMCWGGCTYHRYLLDSKLTKKSIYCDARIRIFSHIVNTIGVEPNNISDLSFANQDSTKRKRDIDAYLDIGRGCNSHCYFCAADSTRRVDVLTDIQISALKKSRQLGAKNLTISGGEPTLHPKIIEITKLARSLGFEHIQLQSNGRRLAQINYLKKLANAGIDEFGLSLHGHDAKTQDRITGRSGSFQQTIRAIENIRLLFGPNPPLSVNCVITPENYKRLADIGCLLLNLDVSSIKFSYLHGTGRAADLLKPGQWPSKSQILPYLIQSIQLIEELGKPYTTLAIEAIPPCLLPGSESYCSDIVIRPILVLNSDGSIEKFFTGQDRSKRSECSECIYDSTCLGPWKEYPEEFGWDEFAPILKIPTL